MQAGTATRNKGKSVRPPLRQRNRSRDFYSCQSAGKLLHCQPLFRSNMSAPAGTGPPPVPDMSHVDPGLQPTLIALLYLFPGLALIVLLIRFWRKSIDHLLGGGEDCRSSIIKYTVTDSCTDDAIIAVAWMLSIGNSVITHLCKKPSVVMMTVV
jgi:hypothetical protein